MSVPRFTARFLVVFALLAALANVSGAPRGFAFLLESVTRPVGAALTGWWLEPGPGTTGTQLRLRRGAQILPMAISLERLSLALLPFLSLIAATPGLGVRGTLLRAAAGSAAIFTLDLVVLLAYPALVRPGPISEAAGTFLGVLAFVGSPAILWFLLTFDRLREVWRL